MGEGLKRLDGRIALVSGGSRGIGRAVALGLAAEGAHVVIIGRVAGALEDTDDAIRRCGGTATLVPLNLTQHDRVDGLGPTLFERFGKLDIFVGNAAILGTLSPLAHTTNEGWQRVMDINLTANWRLIRTLDPLLHRSDAGRVVLMTSGAARGDHAYWGPYAISKAGVEAMARTYAAEVANTAIRVNLFDPGAVATQMRAKAFPGEDQARLPKPADVAPMVVELCMPGLTANGEILRARDLLKQPRSSD